jgi:hypothetical protein
MAWFKVINAQVLPVSRGISMLPRQLFSTAGHGGRVSCAAFPPILSVTTQDSIQAESVTMLLHSLSSVDDNKIGADQPFLFCLARM